MRKIIWNVPNTLTILRFVLSPVFFLFLVYGYTKTALVFFLIVALTDFADGWVARSTGQTTKFGEALDPLADKFMIFLAVIGLSVRFDFPYWAVPLIMVRDIVSIGGSFIYFSRIIGKWKAKILGKSTTLFQTLTVLLFILDLPFKSEVLLFTISLSVATGIVYIFKGYYALKEQ